MYYFIICLVGVGKVLNILHCIIYIDMVLLCVTTVNTLKKD